MYFNFDYIVENDYDKYVPCLWQFLTNWDTQMIIGDRKWKWTAIVIPCDVSIYMGMSEKRMKIVELRQMLFIESLWFPIVYIALAQEASYKVAGDFVILNSMAFNYVSPQLLS